MRTLAGLAIVVLLTLTLRADTRHIEADDKADFWRSNICRS